MLAPYREACTRKQFLGWLLVTYPIPILACFQLYLGHCFETLKANTASPIGKLGLTMSIS